VAQGWHKGDTTCSSGWSREAAVGVEGGGGRSREMVVGGRGWWQVVEGSSGSREMVVG